MSSPYNGGKTAIDTGVFHAFQREGYITADGLRDMTKVRERIFSAVAVNKVLAKKERDDKAVSRGDLVATVFPNLPGPEAWADQPEPALAEAVYRAIDSKYVWGEAKVNAGSPLQRMVGMNMGNGYILCRTKITKDEIQAVYITDDRVCIQEDFIRPDNESTDRKLKAVTDNRELLMLRQPHNAARYAREYGNTMRGTVAAGINRLQLTMESLANNTPDTEDDEEGGAE